jgi:hypothetical protein
MPAELVELMQRYNQLGRLLHPFADDMEDAVKDPRSRAEIRLVLQEMAKAKTQIDQFLLRHGRRPSAAAGSLIADHPARGA